MKYIEELEHYKDDFIKDLRGLLHIPSIRDDGTVEAGAPFGKGCKEALDYMLALGEKEGFVTKNIDGYAGVIEYGEGSESVGVLAHVDIVPIGEGWSKDPFAGEIVDGYMFGRGVLDDKGPAMAAFYALKMLRDQQLPLSKKIMLIYGCDEESGMSCMEYYKKHGEIPSVGFTPDADFPVIYGEKGGMRIRIHGDSDTVIQSMHAGERVNIVIGKASAVVTEWNDRLTDQFMFYLKTNALEGDIAYTGKEATLTIEGTFAHGAMPYLGVNAALHLFNFIGAAFDDAFATKTYHMLKDWQGKPLGIDIDGASMGFLTMNTGVVKIENQHVDIQVDMRYPNDTSAEQIMKGITTTAKNIGYDLAITLDKNTMPLFVDPASKLVQTLTSVYRAYSKDEVTPNKTIGGGTYAKKFDNFVAFGPEFPNQQQPDNMFIGGCHQKDEAFKVEDLMKAMAIYTESIERLAQE